MEREIKRIELEDVSSPRRAQYIISLKQLAEGYIVETCWGGRVGKKNKEAYYREGLQAAVEKFEQILALKTHLARKSRRHYRQVESSQMSLNCLL